MSAENVFYIVGICLAVTAVVVSFIGLRFEKLPSSGGALAAGIGVFVVLVGAATSFAWINAEDEQEARDAEIAAGELPSPAETEEEMGAASLEANAANEGEAAPAQAAENAASDVNGAALFDSQGCAGCHTLKAAGATGTIGPDLDAVLAGEDAAFIKESIVDPSAVVAKGFPDGTMPDNFAESMSPEELDALVAFIAEAVGAKQ
jgi:mono/diheme cytochrome c family protein